MRAGQLDRSITIQSVTHDTNEYGVPVETVTDVAAVRAQLVQASTEEFLRSYGEASETVVIFRIRWRQDITTAHRVAYQGRHFNIRETMEIGRRKGLELRCEELLA